MATKIPLVKLDGDVLNIFVCSAEGCLRKSASDILKILREKHSGEYLDIKKANISDSLNRLEKENLIQRKNCVNPSAEEKRKGGAPLVTRQLNKKLFEKIEIEITSRRRRKPRRSAPDIIEDEKESIAPVAQSEEIPAETLRPTETLEEIEIFLAEKEAHIADLKKQHEEILSELKLVQARLDKSKNLIEDEELSVMEARDTINNARKSLEALNTILSKRG